MLRTPLHAWHEANGGRLVEFAGWSMPIQYRAGPIEEHRLVRRSAGLFDVSHMGQILVRGDGAASFLDRLITSRVSALELNQSTYGLLCREDGGVLDDVFAYRLEDEWLIVVNAANTERDFSWFVRHKPDSGVELENVSSWFAMFAFQGPRAIGVMDTVVETITASAELGGGEGPVSAIPRFSAANLVVDGTGCIIGRTGYTGEDGVEIFVRAENAVPVWERVLAAAESAGVECGPIGLAARDSLRFEPGFALYGHELTEAVSPIHARLKWACDLEKDFIGAEAIRKQVEDGVSLRLATVTMTERSVPREGYIVYRDGAEVGRVASGMYAPTVDAYCANVFVASDSARVGTELQIEIRDRKKRAVVVKRPLYKPAYRQRRQR